MSLKSTLLSVAKKVAASNASAFEAPVDRQKEYLASFCEPKDDIERSFYQYKCQMFLDKAFGSFLSGLASFFIALFYLIKTKRKVVSEPKEGRVAVFLHDGLPLNVMPRELGEEFDEVVTDATETDCLTSEDRRFIRKLIRRHPFSWLFILKCIIKIVRYSGVIRRYRPEALIVCNEYSFTSSVLTAYCAENGVKLNNVMHGEKLFYIRDSFFRYDRCYVWDASYAALFCKLRAYPDQFVVACPDSLKIDGAASAEKTVDYTFYLQDEDEAALTVLAERVRVLAARCAVAIRPHPRYSDPALVGALFDGIEIEDVRCLSIEDSVRRTKNVVSLYSTVLNQAYHSGVAIVIDDVTRPDRYAKLWEREFCLLSVPHGLLSEITGEENE